MYGVSVFTDSPESGIVGYCEVFVGSKTDVKFDDIHAGSFCYTDAFHGIFKR
jgi:hypothetical protein